MARKRFISDSMGEKCRTYVYRGEDRSILYNMFLSDFATTLLKIVPRSVSPNMLTLLGIAHSVSVVVRVCCSCIYCTFDRNNNIDDVRSPLRLLRTVLCFSSVQNITVARPQDGYFLFVVFASLYIKRLTTWTGSKLGVQRCEQPPNSSFVATFLFSSFFI